MNIDEIGSEFVKGVYVSRDLRLSHPIFLKVFPELKLEFGLETGMELHISCTYRSLKAQGDLYAIGRTKPPLGDRHIVTHCDGVNSQSKHNIFPAEAVDVYITYAGKAVWEKKVFEPLGEMVPKYGLYWGGFGLGKNKKFLDRPHIEIASKESIV